MNTIKKSDDFKYQKLIVLPPPVVEKLARGRLTQNIYATDLGFFPDALYHFRERESGSSSYIFILCIDGEGYYKIGDRDPVLLGKGSLLVIPKDVPHRYWAGYENPWSIYFFHINGQLASSYYEHIMPHFHIPLTIDAVSKMIILFDECYDILKNASSQEHFIYASKVAEHFIALAVSCAIPKLAHQNNCDELAVRRAVLYMSEHILQSITLNDLSHVVGYSSSYFTALFKKGTGYSPIDYFLRLKIQDSCKYLDSTTLSVKEVSQLFHFSDQFYFSRLFKKIIGLSPVDYRKRNSSL